MPLLINFQTGGGKFLQQKNDENFGKILNRFGPEVSVCFGKGDFIRGRQERRQRIQVSISISKYLLINLCARFPLSSAVANHRAEFKKILLCDRLQPKVRQN